MTQFSLNFQEPIIWGLTLFELVALSLLVIILITVIINACIAGKTRRVQKKAHKAAKKAQEAQKARQEAQTAVVCPHAIEQQSHSQPAQQPVAQQTIQQQAKSNADVFDVEKYGLPKETPIPVATTILISQPKEETTCAQADIISKLTPEQLCAVKKYNINLSNYKSYGELAIALNCIMCAQKKDLINKRIQEISEQIENVSKELEALKTSKKDIF